MEMKRIHHDVLLRSIKFLNVLLAALIFGLCWRWKYLDSIFESENAAENGLMIVLFAVLYCVFGRIYEAFQISIKRVSEMVYSQALAAFASDSILFLVIWIMCGRFPAIVPMLCCFLVQIIMFLVWSCLSNRLYFRVFPPRATAIIYDRRRGLDAMFEKYGLDRKYDIRLIQNAEDCLQDITVLENLDTVFISGVHSKERNIILKYCIANDIRVFVVPRIGDVLMSSASTSHMFHIPMLSVKRYAATPEYLFAKRLMDILLSLIALIILSPVMLAVALAIKMYDRGPAIYSQIRLTKDGRTFSIYKFRSMRTDAEKDGVARLSTGENDDRITPIGHVIRKLRLDELPQLWNILRGDLSIVGPRPERPEIAAEYCQEMPEFALRLQAKAGLTGYAQVYGKYNTTPYDKLQMDLMYIAHPSLLEDFKIIVATVKILFMPESTEGVEEGQITAIASMHEKEGMNS